MKFFIALVLLPYFAKAVPAFAITMQKNDPYAITLSKPTHQLDVRIFQHGLKGKESLIQEQIKYAELLLSQCPGVTVKIKPIAYQNLSSSTAQENKVEIINGQMVYNKDFLKLIRPQALDRSQGPLDVHMMEYMNKEIRQTKKLNGQIDYGQAFNITSVGTLFKDPRAANEKPALADLAGNSLYLAISTVALQKQSVVKYPQFDAHARGYSLMAHELGHLLLESYVAGTPFMDHYCPQFNDFCERGYLMSSGGNSDSYYTDKTSGQIVGYDYLPKLDNIQCERLKASKYLRRL